ncbi:hypothetical protein TRVL_09642 [Trypanosoma vivax]|nr:hypothetical protein TRVL_09642 [Trypanosoma vivax]
MRPRCHQTFFRAADSGHMMADAAVLSSGPRNPAAPPWALRVAKCPKRHKITTDAKDIKDRIPVEALKTLNYEKQPGRGETGLAENDSVHRLLPSSSLCVLKGQRNASRQQRFGEAGMGNCGTRLKRK